MIIPVNKPLIAKNAQKYVLDCIKTGWISSAGQYIDKFEKKFAQFVNCKYALTCTNGTAALHLALEALDIKKGDEVIVIAGRSKGLRGNVLKRLDDNRLLVENVNMVKKHVKGNPRSGEGGGIIDQESPIQVSNVMLFNPNTQKGDRVGFKTLEDDRKVRYFKSNGEVIDI